MGDILAKRHRARLAEFASSNVLIGFDYDGTLAPIGVTPAAARLRATTRRLLFRVARSYPCVVISGRAHSELSTRLGQLPFWQVYGNHGLEPWATSGDVVDRVEQWVECLRRRLAGRAGLVVEDKKYSVTIHYRRSRDKRAARRAIAAAVRGLGEARVIGGNQAVNVIMRTGPHKGVALQQARQVLACDTVIYVGDDDTDEDAFTSASARQLLAIRVGSLRSSNAQFSLRRQSDIDRFLRLLLALRTRGKANVVRRMASRKCSASDPP